MAFFAAWLSNCIGHRTYRQILSAIRSGGGWSMIIEKITNPINFFRRICKEVFPVQPRASTAEVEVIATEVKPR